MLIDETEMPEQRAGVFHFLMAGGIMIATAILVIQLL